MPKLPNFIYKPTVMYDRLLDQSGSFIIQSIYYSHVKDSVDEILPDYTIAIKDKENIRDSLKVLGINRIKYFNDPDNLAGYLNENYH